MKIYEKRPNILYIHETGIGYEVFIKDHVRRAFSASRYGSMLNALCHAIAYRDNYLAENQLWPKITKSYRYETKTQRIDNTGIIGVTKYDRPKGGKIYRSWVAHIYEKGKQISFSFSVNRYGTVPAFIKACEKRYAAYDELIVCDDDIPISIEKLKTIFDNVTET